MPWGVKIPDLKNNPLYLEPRVTAAETSLADSKSDIAQLKQATLAPVQSAKSETLSVTTSSVLSLNQSTAYVKAIVSVEGGTIRFFATGEDPTSSSGFLLENGDMVNLFDHGEVSKYRAIAISGNPTLQVSYFADLNADFTAPSTPTGLNGVVGDAGITLTWNAVSASDLAGYNIYVGGVKNNTTLITSTTYTVTGLNSNTTYQFQISSVDTTGNESAKSIIVSLTTNSITIVSDVFNRADNATSLGISDTGQTWQYIGQGGLGVWGISSNNATLKSSASSRDIAYVETGKSDCTILLTNNNTSDSMVGIAARTDGTAGYNAIFASVSTVTGSKYGIIKGASSVLGQSTIAPTVGDKLKLVLSGSSIKLYVNDVLACEGTDTTFVNNTKHGITSRLYGAQLDDFKVVI